MALAPIPPWLDINPTRDYVSAMSTGARLGLDRASIATQANEAQDRLRLSYAQLAAENARAQQKAQEDAADRAVEQARLSAAAQIKERDRQDALGQWAAEHAQKQTALDLAGKRETRMETAAEQLAKYRQDTLGERTKMDAMKLDPVTHAKYLGSQQRVKNARAMVNHALANDDTAALKAAQDELAAAIAEQQQLESSITSQLHPADAAAPNGWVPTTGAPGVEEWLRPRRPLESGAPDEAAAAPDKTIQVGKYKVTPLNQ